MSKTRIVSGWCCWLGVACASVLVLATPAAAQSVLSAAQNKAIAQKTAKLSQGELEIVAGWSDRQKLAEFFCSPLALAEFKKADKTANRVSLGPDEAGVEKFVLEGNYKLSGRGTVRHGGPWRSYTFECAIDPDKAIATSFTYTLDAK